MKFLSVFILAPIGVLFFLGSISRMFDSDIYKIKEDIIYPFVISIILLGIVSYNVFY